MDRLEQVVNTTFINLIRFNLFNPFTPRDFGEKHILKLVEWFSGHCCATKSYDLPQSCLQVVNFAARCKMLACEVRTCAESKFLGLKVTKQS